MHTQHGQLHAVEPLRVISVKKPKLQVIKGRAFRIPVQREQAKAYVDGVFYV